MNTPGCCFSFIFMDIHTDDTVLKVTETANRYEQTRLGLKDNIFETSMM